MLTSCSFALESAIFPLLEVVTVKGVRTCGLCFQSGLGVSSALPFTGHEALGSFSFFLCEMGG